MAFIDPQATQILIPAGVALVVVALTHVFTLPRLVDKDSHLYQTG